MHRTAVCLTVEAKASNEKYSVIFNMDLNPKHNRTSEPMKQNSVSGWHAAVAIEPLNAFTSALATSRFPTDLAEGPSLPASVINRMS